MKKIIPTVLMSVCALAAIGGSSFAWFTENATVNATGISITASTGATLVIKEGVIDTIDNMKDGTAYKTSASLESGSQSAAKACQITSTGLVQTAKTFKEGKAPTPAYAGEAETFNDVAQIQCKAGESFVKMTAGDNVYVAGGNVSIARISSGTSNYKISTNVTFACEPDAFKLVDKALSFGIFYGSTFVSAAVGDTEPVSNVYTVNLPDVTGFTDNKVEHLALCVYYDGSNTNCYTNAALNAALKTVSFHMTAETYTA